MNICYSIKHMIYYTRFRRSYFTMYREIFYLGIIYASMLSLKEFRSELQSRNKNSCLLEFTTRQFEIS